MNTNSAAIRKVLLLGLLGYVLAGAPVAQAAISEIHWTGISPLTSSGGTFTLLTDANNPSSNDIVLNPNFTSSTADDKTASDPNWGSVLDVSLGGLSAKTTTTSLNSKAAGGQSLITRTGNFSYSTTSASATSASLKFDYSFLDDTGGNPLMHVYATLYRISSAGGVEQLLDTTIQFDPAASQTPFAFDFTASNNDQFFLSLSIDAAADVAAAPVPVPAALPLLASALAGLGGFRARTRTRSRYI
ncbi:MAG: hypothetical protein U1F34_08750 [Gammaproteobacteria bacterium]